MHALAELASADGTAAVAVQAGKRASLHQRFVRGAALLPACFSARQHAVAVGVQRVEQFPVVSVAVRSCPMVAPPPCESRARARVRQLGGGEFVARQLAVAVAVGRGKRPGRPVLGLLYGNRRVHAVGPCPGAKCQAKTDDRSQTDDCVMVHVDDSFVLY